MRSRGHLRPNTAINPTKGLISLGFLTGLREAAGRPPFLGVSFPAVSLPRLPFAGYCQGVRATNEPSDHDDHRSTALFDP